MNNNNKINYMFDEKKKLFAQKYHSYLSITVNSV